MGQGCQVCQWAQQGQQGRMPFAGRKRTILTRSPDRTSSRWESQRRGLQRRVRAVVWQQLWELLRSSAWWGRRTLLAPRSRWR